MSYELVMNIYTGKVRVVELEFSLFYHLCDLSCSIARLRALNCLRRRRVLCGRFFPSFLLLKSLELESWMDWQHSGLWGGGGG